MKSARNKTSPPACWCGNCLCRRGPRCRCHAYNALLALALWDFGRMVRRRHLARPSKS